MSNARITRSRASASNASSSAMQPIANAQRGSSRQKSKKKARKGSAKRAAVADAPISQTMDRNGSSGTGHISRGNGVENENGKKKKKGTKRAALNDLSNQNGRSRQRIDKNGAAHRPRTRSRSRNPAAEPAASSSSSSNARASKEKKKRRVKKAKAPAAPSVSAAGPPAPSTRVLPAPPAAAPQPEAQVIDLTVSADSHGAAAPEAPVAAPAPSSPTPEVEPPLPLRTTKIVKRAIDIDAEKARDPRYASTYAKDIYAFRKRHELLYRPTGDYLKNFQEDITPNMRAILVDWLVEVAEEYTLKQETLFTSVNYIDRCLGLFQVTRHKLQLLGCACMLIAAKYEEIYAPCVEEFVYISDNTYTHDQVLRYEGKVLGALKFKLTVCTPMTFLPRFLRAANAEDKAKASYSQDKSNRLKCLTMYLTELGLQDYGMVHFRQSMIAAAAISLARKTLRFGEIWHYTLEHYSGYSLDELSTCERKLHQCHRKANGDKLQAIKRKNGGIDFLRISTVVEPLAYLH